MRNGYDWIVQNWMKATPFLVVYLTIVVGLYVAPADPALALIWLHVPMYFLHQFEEYIFPGNFVGFFNTKPLGSDFEDFPLSREASFWINFPIIFIGFPISAIMSGWLEVAAGLWIVYFSLLNALSHIGMYVRYGYNPGLVVSVTINIPVGVFTIWYFVVMHQADLWAHIVSMIIAVTVQGSLMVYGLVHLRRKTSRSSPLSAKRIP